LSVILLYLHSFPTRRSSDLIFKGAKITPIVKHFKVFSEVNDVAKEHGADLIIMGSQGTSGFSEIFVGSNTEKVVRYSDVPVLVLDRKSTRLNSSHVKISYAV